MKSKMSKSQAKRDADLVLVRREDGRYDETKDRHGDPRKGLTQVEAKSLQAALTKTLGRTARVLWLTAEAVQ